MFVDEDEVEVEGEKKSRPEKDPPKATDPILAKLTLGREED